MSQDATDKDMAKKLLVALLPANLDRECPRHMREAHFKAASVALSVIASPPDDQMLVRAASWFLKVDERQVAKALNLPFAKHLARLNGGSRPVVTRPSVVGVHFVDRDYGRFSKIWLPSSNAPDGLVNLRWSYPELWLRVYKHLLHPTTSLLNAYQNKLLEWQDTSVWVRWDCTRVPAVSQVKRVSIKRNYNRMFVEETETRLKQFHDLIVKQLRDIDLLNEPIEKIDSRLDGLERQLETEVNRCWPVDVLRHIRETYLLKLIQDREGGAQREFLALLNDLSGSSGDLRRRLARPGVWDGAERNTLKQGIEVLQTILFNAPGFCGREGFVVEQMPCDGDAQAYLLLGFKQSLGLDLARHKEMRHLFEQTIKATYALLKTCPEIPIDVPALEKRDGLIHGILERLKPEGIETDHAYRILEFVTKLCKEAIHEGHDLSFLIGFGHAERPEIMCRKAAISVPERLRMGSVNLDLLVHFVKGYFSLIGRGDKLLWFDTKARCHGIFERSPQDSPLHWLDRWPKDCYFIRIESRGRFDVYELDPLLDRHRPRIRVEGDRLDDLLSVGDVQLRCRFASARVFGTRGQVYGNRETRYHWIAKLVAAVADRLREKPRGAGLVVLDEPAKNVMSETAPNTWRVPFDAQWKPLVDDLEHFQDPVVDFTALARADVDGVAERICSLAELDGAVLLRCTQDHMNAYPARQFFPLVAEGPAPAQRELLNFYKWADEGEAKVSLASLKALRAHIDPIDNLSLRERKSLTVARDMQRFDSNDSKLLKLYLACIRGLSPDLRNSSIYKPIQRICNQLSFLTSAGTRNHSLWGITVTSVEDLFAVAISHDGRASVFWDGLLIPHVEKNPS